MTEMSFRPHDLLHVDVSEVRCADGEKDRCKRLLARAPWVVVRRAIGSNRCIPIGIRGCARSERVAASIDHRFVYRRRGPEDLLGLTSPRDLPALNAFAWLQEQWRSISWSWGPTGSVGFELATGVPVCHVDSDLDLRLLVPQRLTSAEARELLHAAECCEVNTDVQVETPRGAFALRDFVQNQGASCLLRTLSGPLRTRAPWDDELRSVASASSLRRGA